MGVVRELNTEKKSFSVDFHLQFVAILIEGFCGKFLVVPCCFKLLGNRNLHIGKHTLFFFPLSFGKAIALYQFSCLGTNLHLGRNLICQILYVYGKALGQFCVALVVTNGNSIIAYGI